MCLLKIAVFEKPKTKPNSLEPDTTVLSPYLTHGCVSVRQAYHAVSGVYDLPQFKGKHSQPPVSMHGQFLWREHWYVIAYFIKSDISVMRGNPLSRQIPWDEGPEAAAKLQKWANAKTGFPFIDAIMTQLKEEGGKFSRR